MLSSESPLDWLHLSQCNIWEPITEMTINLVILHICWPWFSNASDNCLSMKARNNVKRFIKGIFVGKDRRNEKEQSGRGSGLYRHKRTRNES